MRGRGRRGFNNIYTLNIVPYHQKCFLFVCSSYRGLKKNIISCQRVSNACTAWWFLLRNILVIFCCVQDSVHGLLNENGNIPRPLSPEGVVWVSETNFKHPYTPYYKLFDRHSHSYFQEIPGGLIFRCAYFWKITVFQNFKIREIM